MIIAKIFKSGNSQAVRLPKEFQFNGNEVYIKKTGQGVLLIPKDDIWERFEESLSEPGRRPLLHHLEGNLVSSPFLHNSISCHFRKKMYMLDKGKCRFTIAAGDPRIPVWPL